MDDDDYMRITKVEYAHMANVILSLREQKQKARESLERNEPHAALEILRRESE